jgi:Flp pilus assembly protein TadD
VPTIEPTAGEAHGELEAGLLALESGSAAPALELLRRATYKDPSNPLAQFALARAYLGARDIARAQAALLHTRRLLAGLDGAAMVPGSDALLVETLRQAVHSHLNGIAASAS